MAERVASILAEIGIDGSKFTSGKGDILTGLNAISGGFASTALQAATLAGAMTLLATEYKKAVNAAVEAEKVQANLNASIKSTGGAAGLTSKQLNDMADSLSSLTGVDDELIVSAEAMMLTFKDVRGKTFNAAMLAALDMQAKGFGNLEGNVVQLGKALSSFTGYTALQRSGVNFNAVQIQQIKNFQKTNDLAGYQALVMQELNSQVGGTAAAMNAASDGSANLNIEIGNLYEHVGKELLPEVRGLTRDLTDFLHTVNANWEGIMRLYYALDAVRRVIQFIGTLGISEVIRWWMTRNRSSDTTPGGNLPDSGGINNAAGGSFIIPQSYGHEGFRLGNYGTASGGERVTITPATSSGNMGASVVINGLTIGDTSGLSRGDIVDMMLQVVNEAMA